MRYCGACGARLKRLCPACGFANPDAYNFCGQCGFKLGEGPPDIPGSAEKAPPPISETATASPPQPTPVSETPPRLEGERRVATIILADVKGSTELLEQVGTEAWVGIMNRVFQILEAEIYRYGGKVDQFRGDGLVAFFGATGAHEDDPERAVLAGLGMQQALKRYAAELAELQGVDLSLRVGINTGEVIVASVGNSQYSEDTAMGGAITLAARMETAAEPGTVLVSENTYRLVQSHFEWKVLGEIPLKGISHPVAVYRPLAHRPSVERPKYELSSPLIGRDAELQALKGCIERLKAGGGGIVILTGERGIGKSLLLSEMRHYFARQSALLAEARDRGAGSSKPDKALVAVSSAAGDSGENSDLRQLSNEIFEQQDEQMEMFSSFELRELRGRCRSYNQSQPYAMWLDLLQNWLGMPPSEDKELSRNRLRHEASALWGARMGEHYPYLVTLLGLPLEEAFEEKLRHLDAEGLRQQIFLAIRSWVEALTQQGPLIITLTDMHWADTTSLELLRYCLPLCDQEALLWTLVFRPERTSPIWQFRYYVETEYPHRLTSLHLLPLNKAQSKEFIELLIGPDALPQEPLELIVGKAEGNPYYIQELIRALIAQGVLVRETEADEQGEKVKWRLARPVTSLELPDSLQTLLLARVDRLSPEEQRVLQMAAVIGQVFWSNVLQALAGSAVNVRAQLTALQRAQLIREQGRVPQMGTEYVFNSTLIRDAVYDGLLSAQRELYHLQVAEYLEKRFATEMLSQYRSLYYGALAYHYRCAGKLDKELFYTLQMAKHAREVYANAEAVEHYNHALELLDKMDVQTTALATAQTLRQQRFEVLQGRREVNRVLGNFEAMRTDAQALLPLARQMSSDPVWLIDALLKQPGVDDFQDANPELVRKAIPMAEEALRLAQQLNDHPREIEALIAMINQRLMLGDPGWKDIAERALQLAQQVGDERYEARLLLGMGRIYAMSDQPERSIEYLQAATALSIVQAPDDKPTQIALLDLLGLQYERNGDYYRLLNEYQHERLCMSREIGHRVLEADALFSCGEIQGLYLGDYETGLILLEASRSIMKGTAGEAIRLIRIAQIQANQYRYKEALANLARARESQENRPSLEANLNLVTSIVYTYMWDEERLKLILELAEKTRQLTQNPLLSQQYAMAAASHETLAYLGLGQKAATEETRREHYRLALEASQKALSIFQNFGFVQITECVSEEVLYRHSQALAANERHEEAILYLEKAYDEMLRKRELIPQDTAYYHSYLNNIPLHQDIYNAYTTIEELSRE